MADTVNWDDLKMTVRQTIASVSYAGKTKTSKRLDICVETTSKQVWYDVFVQKKFYGQYFDLDEAIHEFNYID